MLIETIVTLAGLCISFAPALMYFKYLLNHVNSKTRFDYHIQLVKDKKGRFGVIVAYLERILFGTWITSMGVSMSEFFENEMPIRVFVVSLILYFVIKYIDEENEK